MRRKNRKQKNPRRVFHWFCVSSVRRYDDEIIGFYFGGYSRGPSFLKNNPKSVCSPVATHRHITRFHQKNKKRIKAKQKSNHNIHHPSSHYHSPTTQRILPSLSCRERFPCYEFCLSNFITIPHHVEISNGCGMDPFCSYNQYGATFSIVVLHCKGKYHSNYYQYNCSCPCS
jgi:hypothetical protein